MKRLLNADGADGGGGAAGNAGSDAGGPPAGETVATGKHTEAENELRKQLDTERTAHGATAAEKKKREQRVAELEDELHRLKAAVNPSAPTGQPWRYRPFKRTEKKEA